MKFTFINTRILPGGSTIVKTDDESIYLGSNINVAIFIFLNEGNYSFEGFTLEEVSNIKKIISNFNNRKKNISNYYKKEFCFKNVDSMLIPHKVVFNINDDFNLFIKEVNKFYKIEKINVSYLTDVLTLVGYKKIYGLSDEEKFYDFMDDKKYSLNDSLLKKQSATVYVFDVNKYNIDNQNSKGKKFRKMFK